jgi:ferredoxin
MAWHVEVDGKTCIASGMCASLSPEHFRLDDDHSRPVTDDITPDDIVLDAADSCPAGAITVLDNGLVIGPRP